MQTIRVRLLHSRVAAVRSHQRDYFLARSIKLSTWCAGGCRNFFWLDVLFVFHHRSATPQPRWSFVSGGTSGKPLVPTRNSDALLLAAQRTVMPAESKLLLAVSLLLVSGMTIAGENSIERCRVPPKVIIENAEEQYLPSSTAMPPIGKVVLEFTVTTEGAIRDVLVVEPVDSRLERWAKEKSKKLRFQAVGKACRSRFTLESRIADGATHA